MIIDNVIPIRLNTKGLTCSFYEIAISANTSSIPAASIRFRWSRQGTMRQVQPNPTIRKVLLTNAKYLISLPSRIPPRQPVSARSTKICFGQIKFALIIFRNKLTNVCANLLLRNLDANPGIPIQLHKHVLALLTAFIKLKWVRFACRQLALHIIMCVPCWWYYYCIKAGAAARHKHLTQTRCASLSHLQCVWRWLLGVFFEAVCKYISLHPRVGVVRTEAWEGGRAKEMQVHLVWV